MERLLFDTDVLIEYLRGRDEAKTFFDSIENTVFISAMTVAELYAEVRSGKEIDALEIFLDTFEIVTLNNKIAKAGGRFRNQFFSSHGVGLADALIAATAEDINAQLVTFNSKHFFPMLSDVIKPYGRS